MSLTLPPRYVSAPTADVYDLSLSDAHFRTLVQIRGLAWKTKGERTPPMTIEDLMAIRGLSRSGMFEHLKILREGGYVRTELIGPGRFVIYPLRWEPGAALSTDARDDLTDEERAALLGDEALEESPENGTPSPENGTQHVHVVVHADSGQKQQHDSVLSPEIWTQAELLLLARMTAVFCANGADDEAAEAKAAELLDACGPEVCARQLATFERRCQLARAGPRGLQNPAGLFVASVRGDWDLPGDGDGQTQCWYTDEEYEQFFEH